MRRRQTAGATLAVSVLLFASAVPAYVAADCTCNDSPRPAAGAPSFTVDAPSLGNVALDVMSAALTLLTSSDGLPHKVAMVAAILYDAYAATDDTKRPLSEKSVLGNASVSTEAEQSLYVGFAAYAALEMILESEPEKLLTLRARMAALGLEEEVLASHPSRAIVGPIMMKYALKPPETMFMAKNPPSGGFDPDCEALKVSDAWQAQCVQMEPGMPCMPQAIPFGAFFNASLITANGEKRVNELIKDIPGPPTFDGSLPELPFSSGESNFADEHLQTLETSGKLDDEAKWQGEFFQPNAVIRVGNIAVNEALARNLSLSDSTALLIAVFAATRDAVAATVTIKLSYQTVRPVTVLQCAFRGQEMTAWNAPYYGVRTFTSGEDDMLWRPYLQTPGFPGYTSGHSAVAAAGMKVLSSFFSDGRPLSANCATQMPGMSSVEPMILKGSSGYIKGVTDVPNEGPATVGYSPAKNVTLCWNSFGAFAEQLTKSRELAGIHIPIDNSKAQELGESIGSVAYEFIMKKYKNFD